VVPTFETEAVVLRAIRYAEADSVLALLSLERGRVSAIAKGARRATSRLGGRLQPGVRARVTLHEGRGDMMNVRGAAVLDPNAGLWAEGYRLRAASSLLESALRTTADREPTPGAYHLVVRALGLLAGAPARAAPPRLDPVVVGARAKLLVVGGLLPRLSECAACGGPPPLLAFSAGQGGALCAPCAGLGEPVDPAALAALAALVGRPLAEAPDACPPALAPGVERMIGLVLREHLGVTLKSATPL
jgi:DNA repair protein RecO (recombination protein O)